MKQLFMILAALSVTTPTFAQLPTVTQMVPESVVRIYVNENRDQIPDSYGSGVLISPTQILTNYHVVEDRRKDRRNNSRAVQVRFADGSRSYAVVISQNKLWDIALLGIHATKLTPITIGNRPKAGDKATIQGLGPDYEYKQQTGTVSDAKFHPEYHSDKTDYIEILEVRARGGDSGGPITDIHGNLGGLLHGASDQSEKPYTQGTTIDRIRKVFGSKMKPSRVAESDYTLYKEKSNEK